MKNIKILLFSFLLSLIILPKIFSYSFYLSMYDDSEFMVTLNKRGYDSPVKMAVFDNINKSSNYLTVIKKTGYPGGSLSIIYEGYIKIPDDYNVYGVIDESGNFVIYKKTRTELNEHYDCGCDCEYCRQCKYKHPDPWSEYDCGYKAISPYEFNDLKKLISDMSFESTKLEIAKSGIDKNYFIVEQVKELLQLFSFESNRLDLAKYIYQKTCDKNRYYKIYDAFTFESSVSDMEEFIRHQNYK